MVSRARTLFVVCCAASVALAIARSPISQGLVVRGDDFLYRGQPARAISYYRRALFIDSANGLAADRFAFAALIVRNSSQMRIAATACLEYLRKQSNDQTVRLDRALLLRALGQTQRAEEELAFLGRARSDARLLAFAGFAALSLGQRATARRLFLQSVAVAPTFEPALRALRRMR